MPALEKSPLAVSLSLSLSLNKQKTDYQSESNSATSWTPNPWTTSLKKVARHFFPKLPV
jgi:hypothetical protein